MKFIAPFIFLFLIPVWAFACSCAFGNYSAIDKYLTSDFVGVVEIERLEDVDLQRRYKVGLKKIEIYKGTMPAFVLVQGNAKGEIQSAACEIRINKDEIWLFYLNKNKDGEYHINLCSFPVKMMRKNDSLQTLQEHDQVLLEYFELLEEYVPEMHTNYSITETSGAIFKFKRQYKGSDLEQGLYLYQITFNPELEIQKVEPLKGASSKFDRELEAYLKTDSEWEISYRYKTEKLATEAEVIPYIIRIKPD